MLKMRCTSRTETEGGDGAAVFSATFTQVMEEPREDANSSNLPTGIFVPPAAGGPAAMRGTSGPISFTIQSPNESDLAIYPRGTVCVLQPVTEAAPAPQE